MNHKIIIVCHYITNLSLQTLSFSWELGHSSKGKSTSKNQKTDNFIGSVTKL